MLNSDCTSVRKIAKEIHCHNLKNTLFQLEDEWMYLPVETMYSLDYDNVFL